MSLFTKSIGKLFLLTQIAVEYPVMCIDSSSCEMWFQMGKFVSRKIREEESVLCRKCSLLKGDLVHQIKWTQEESLSRKVACRSAS